MQQTVSVATLSTANTGSVWTYNVVDVSSSSTPLTVNMSDGNLGTSADVITRFDECDPSLASCQAQRMLFIVFAPILCIMAVVGNALGIAVMRRKLLVHTASAVFITSLAVSDTTAVLTALIRHIHLKLKEVSASKPQLLFFYKLLISLIEKVSWDRILNSDNYFFIPFECRDKGYYLSKLHCLCKVMCAALH